MTYITIEAREAGLDPAPSVENLQVRPRLIRWTVGERENSHER